MTQTIDGAAETHQLLQEDYTDSQSASYGDLSGYTFCGDRVFSLSPGASSFITLDTGTNQLTLQATDVQATQSTQFTEQLTVSLASHPSITETVTIEIDLVNPCISTRVQSTHWPIELTHAFGDPATVLTLEDAIFPDTESETSGNQDGYSFCGAVRLYSFVVTPSNPYLDTSQASLTELRFDVTDPLAVSQVYHDHLRVEIYMFGA